MSEKLPQFLLGQIPQEEARHLQDLRASSEHAYKEIGMQFCSLMSQYSTASTLNRQMQNKLQEICSRFNIPHHHPWGVDAEGRVISSSPLPKDSNELVHQQPIPVTSKES